MTKFTNKIYFTGTLLTVWLKGRARFAHTMTPEEISAINAKNSSMQWS